jgi:Tfp pilus assembly protein PilF
MGTRSLRTAISLLILSGCAAAVPELKPPPEGLAWSPEAPFRNQRKTEISSEAQAFSHFLKGYALLGEGDFDPALKEFEAAVAAEPNDAFLHFRLASLYLRKGDLKKALVEAETAVGWSPRAWITTCFWPGSTHRLTKTKKVLPNTMKFCNSTRQIRKRSFISARSTCRSMIWRAPAKDWKNCSRLIPIRRSVTTIWVECAPRANFISPPSKATARPWS